MRLNITLCARATHKHRLRHARILVAHSVARTLITIHSIQFRTEFLRQSSAFDLTQITH